MPAVARFLGAALLALSLGAGGCTTVAKTAPPPPPAQTARPKAPFKPAVWVQGHYRWSSGRYIWVAGKWVEPKPEHHWVSGHWTKTSRGYVWVKGSWKPGKPPRAGKPPPERPPSTRPPRPKPPPPPSPRRLDSGPAAAAPCTMRAWAHSAFPALLFVVAALLWSAEALAFPWYVPDPTLASQVETALEQNWPQHAVEVQVGTRPPETEAFSLEDGVLTLFTKGAEHVRDVKGDPTTAVVLARSWAHTFEIPDSSRVPEPPPPDEPPSDARYLRLEVGLGVRDSFAEAGFVEGLNLGVRFDLGLFGAGIDVYFNLGAYNRLSAFDQELIDSVPAGADSTVPLSPVDQFTIDLFVDYRFGRAPASKRVTVHPRIVAAFELRRWVPRQADLTEDGQTIQLLDSRVDVGPVIGLGAEAWYDRRVGLRATVYDRFRFREDATTQKSPVGQDFTLKLEFLVAP